jgi:hypothetical protein
MTHAVEQKSYIAEKNENMASQEKVLKVLANQIISNKIKFLLEKLVVEHYIWHLQRPDSPIMWPKWFASSRSD